MRFYTCLLGGARHFVSWHLNEVSFDQTKSENQRTSDEYQISDAVYVLEFLLSPLPQYCHPNTCKVVKITFYDIINFLCENLITRFKNLIG